MECTLSYTTIDDKVIIKNKRNDVLSAPSLTLQLTGFIIE